VNVAMWIAVLPVAVALSQTSGTVDTSLEMSYLEFREERMLRRLARAKTVLGNLQAREAYVDNALSFQNYKAEELVHRAATDQTELNTDEGVLTALVERVPGLTEMVNVTLAGETKTLGKEVKALTANVTEFLASPIWTQLEELNSTYLARRAGFEEIDASLNDTEKEVAPWEEDYGREARALTTKHVDGLLLRMNGKLAQTVEETTKELESSEEEDGANETASTPPPLDEYAEEENFDGY